jgi:hypothetical protein
MFKSTAECTHRREKESICLSSIDWVDRLEPLSQVFAKEVNGIKALNNSRQVHPFQEDPPRMIDGFERSSKGDGKSK